MEVEMWYSYIDAEFNDRGAIRARVTTEADSPWFAGHFPGDPVLPGIAQLHMVSESILKTVKQDLAVQSLSRIKFKKLIRPGNILDILIETGKKENSYSFRITSEQQEVCSGRMVLTPTKE